MCAARGAVGGVCWACIILLVLMSMKQADVPFIHQLDYLLGRARHQGWEENAQIWLIGPSFGFIAIEHGQRVFGGISFWKTMASRGTRISSEITLWWLTMCALPYVWLSFFLGYKYWPWFAFAGYAAVAANNLITSSVRKQVERAIAPAAGPAATWFARSRIGREKGGIHVKSETLRRWTLAMLSVTAFMLGVSILSAVHWIQGYHDYLTLAIIIAFLNTFVLGLSQIIRQGEILKGNLSQYCVAGEILRGPMAASRPRAANLLAKLMRRVPL
jgi:hypothetical protein